MTNKITKIISFAVAVMMVLTTGFSIITSASAPIVSANDTLTTKELYSFCSTIYNAKLRDKCNKLELPLTFQFTCNSLYPAYTGKSIVRKKVSENAINSCLGRVSRYKSSTTVSPEKPTKIEQDKIDESRAKESEAKGTAKDLVGTTPAGTTTNIPKANQPKVELPATPKEILTVDSIVNFDDICIKTLVKQSAIDSCLNRAKSTNNTRKIYFNALRKEFCYKYTKSTFNFNKIEKSLRDPIYKKCVTISQIKN
jgi:hypothetical protein